MVQLRRTAANAAAYDLECELVSPSRAQELWPAMQVDDVLGALWLPGRRHGQPHRPHPVAGPGRPDRRGDGARGRAGHRLRHRRRRRVTGVADRRRHRGVRRRRQLRGPVGRGPRRDGRRHRAAALRASTSTWSPRRSTASIPTCRSCATPTAGRTSRARSAGWWSAGSSPRPSRGARPPDLPHPFEFQLLEEDWEHFEVLMDEAVRRVPALAETGIRRFYNGPESFTPDNQFLLGHAPELDNFFVGAGFNSVGIASAGGAGRALAEWIVAGEPTSDLTGVDVRRFAPFAADGDRCATGWSRPSACTTPCRGPTASPRPPAASGSRRCTSGWRSAARSSAPEFGWERPLFFGGELEYSWGRPAWLEASCAEQRACRTGVAVFDQTSFSKYAVTGDGALRGAAVGVRRRRGRRGRAGRLHARGSTPAAPTRPTSRSPATARASFWVVSSSATTVRDLDWLRRHGGIAAPRRDRRATPCSA